MIYPLSLKKQPANASPRGPRESLARHYGYETFSPPLYAKKPIR